MTRKPDEIMAEYLLNGGRMLSESCKTCGAPMFEVKGKKICVVCAEYGKQTSETAAESANKPQSAENIRIIVPEYAKASVAKPAVQTDLANSLDSLIAEFCRRAHEETDTSKCLTLVECIRTTAEAKIMLNRK